MWSVAQAGLLASGAGLNIDLDVTLLIQLALFIGLWIYLRKVLFKPYLAARNAREDLTEGARAEASEVQTRVDEALGSYRAALTSARNAAAAKRAELVGEGEAKAGTVLGEARADAVKVREEADSNLKKELSDARDDVRKQAESLSVAIAERILA